uniref:C2 domain-containing protein n=1 Tax=Panagrellus redivivus TaxID=6233 RepID=A0A7E4ZUJ6_PANRE
MACKTPQNITKAKFVLQGSYIVFILIIALVQRRTPVLLLLFAPESGRKEAMTVSSQNGRCPLWAETYPMLDFNGRVHMHSPITYYSFKS